MSVPDNTKRLHRRTRAASSAPSGGHLGVPRAPGRRERQAPGSPAAERESESLALVRAPRQRITLFGLPILAATSSEALEEIRLRALQAGVRLAYVNAHTLNLAHRDDALLAALRGCDLVLNDGVGVSFAARLRGMRFPENLQGTDFNLRLLDLASEQGWPVFLLGARPGVAARAATELARRLPRLRIVGSRHGFHDDPDGDVEAVRASGAQVLMVAMGSPRQELWLAQHFASLPQLRIGVGVGAFLDFQARVTPRAPEWMIEHKVEWVYRLRCEPRRLAGRYLLGNPTFVVRAMRDAARPAGEIEQSAV